MTTRLSTEEILRLTVAALLSRTGERQADLGAGIGLTAEQVSRRQAGRTAWTLADVDRMAAHWNMHPLDLLSGPTQAATVLNTPQDSVQAPGAPEPAAPAARLPRPPRMPAESRTAAPEPEPRPAPPVPHRAAPPGPIAATVRSNVERTLRERAGDVESARAALIKRAIPDVMSLFAASRVGGRYEHSEFPPTADILQKASQKGADQIWEGRPKWRAEQLHRSAREGLITLDVTALDMNAAYLAAFKCWLPIGKLVHETGDLLDLKRAGVYLITPPVWEVEDLPNPLGDRKVSGDLWVPDPLLRLLLDCARKGLCKAPVIHESWTSGATESLLEKLRRGLRDARIGAIERGDDLTVEYVKSMYSKFVSTIGESTANRDIRRPDWMHIIRSQAFANLWRKAHKAHLSGLTVVQMAGTDELHLAGEWQQVFTEGRDLAEVKAKHTYRLGGEGA